MNINYTLVDEILDAIFPLPEKFGIGGGMEYIEDIAFHLQGYISEDIKVYHGVSKMVIVSDNLGDVVIKVPFNGQYSCGCLSGPCRHSSKWIGKSENGIPIEFDYFCGAGGSDKSDYCLAEYEKYQDLEDVDLSIFVAETLFYKVKDGVRIFLQERVNPVEDSIATPRPSEKSIKAAKRYNSDSAYVYMDCNWIANCIENYGEEITEKFLSYATDIDEDILGDMHDGNFGYRDDGTPVLLDFCDFNS